MTRFALNLALAVIWCFLWGSVTAWNFVAGLLVGAVVVSVYGRATGDAGYLHSIWAKITFGLYFFRILTKANLQIAWEIITPGYNFKPRFIRYPVDGLDEVELTVLANAITLTPGTLVVDVSPDRKYLYLHCMYAENREAQVAEIDELADRIRKGVFSRCG